MDWVRGGMMGIETTSRTIAFLDKSQEPKQEPKQAT